MELTYIRPLQFRWTCHSTISREYEALKEYWIIIKYPNHIYVDLIFFWCQFIIADERTCALSVARKALK